MSKTLLEEAAAMIIKLADRLEGKMEEVADLKAIIVDDTILVQRSAARIEVLEAALRKVIENNDSGSYESTGQAIDEARAVLDRK